MAKNIVVERINKGNLIFSIVSLISSFALIILIIFQKQLHLMTFYFIFFIIISEIINSIANIIQSKDKDDDLKKLTFSFVLFSDIFTNILFLFYSYSSVKLIKETNKTIKHNTKTFIIISFVISVLYFVFFLALGIGLEKGNDYIDVRFKDYYSKNDRNEFEFPKKFYFLSLFHTIIIMIISSFTIQNFYSILKFLEEKSVKDIINYQNIIRIIKVLYRYALIIFLSWIFIIPRTLFVAVCGSENNTLRDIFYLFSESFFCLRGFLICFNTVTSAKIKTILVRFFEVNIKHFLLLNFKYKNRKKTLEKKSYETQEKKSSEPLIIND